MIEITSLTKTYRSGAKAVHALNGIDLQIGPGMFGLLGPNGAGKTTLMRILAGIVNRSQGSVRVNGHDLATEQGKRAVKSVLGYLPQELGMYNELNAVQFVDYMAILKGLDDPRRRQQAVHKVLELVGLGENAGRKIKSFSGGMKRRVGIAQALVNDPKLLIVDEPTAGLDPEERVRFRNLLTELGQGRLVILSTHIVSDIESIATHVAVIREGRLAASGTPEELLRAAAGTAWEATLPSEELAAYRTRLTVSSAVRRPDSVRVRLVADAAPLPGARPVEPTLEDAYLFLIRRDTAARRGPAS